MAKKAAAEAADTREYEDGPGVYPRMLYHAKRKPVIVKDVEAHKALGPEWKVHPDDV